MSISYYFRKNPSAFNSQILHMDGNNNCSYFISLQLPTYIKVISFLFAPRDQ